MPHFNRQLVFSSPQLLVLKYVQNKDVFMRYHKAHLTRRLILDISADSEIEENMVEWLRVRLRCADGGSNTSAESSKCECLFCLHRKLECRQTMSTSLPECFRTSRCRRISTSLSKRCTNTTSLLYRVNKSFKTHLTRMMTAC